MTRVDGKPCVRCGTSRWYDNGHCIECKRVGNKKWRRNNPERERENRRKWQRDNHEKNRESDRKWQQANPDKARKSRRKWQQDNPEKVAATDHRRRTRKTQAGGSYTAEEFKQLCKQYNNRCLRCGKKKKLEFDHVIPVSKGGGSDIGNGQPLCRSCNSKKGTKTTDYRTKDGFLRWIQNKLFD